jgi:hypothetical protein
VPVVHAGRVGNPLLSEAARSHMIERESGNTTTFT